MIQVFNARRVLRRRLLWVALLSASLVGILTWFAESEKIDERVMTLALNAAHRISPENLEAHAAGQLSDQQLETLVQEVAADHFGIVELYDSRKRKLIEYVPPALEALEQDLTQNGHVPLSDQPAYVKRLVQGRFALVVGVPIRHPEQPPSGYLEGVYLPDQETLRQIEADVLRTVGLVVLAILFTTLAVYPVVLTLHKQVLERSRAILRGNLELLEVLGGAIAQRDSDTNVHNYRVTLYAVALAEAVGLAGEAMRNLIAGAFLHDVGKIGISDNILLKPGKLTPEEFQIMKSHVALGVDILKQSQWLEQARDVVAYHHERYDGSGYLAGLAGEEIPLNARIFAVVDVFDALTSRRPYKAPMSPAAALEIMGPERGRHFDPRLFDRFIGLATTLHARYADADEASLAGELLPALERYFMNKTAA